MIDEKMMVRSITYTIDLDRLDDIVYLSEVSAKIECIKNKYSRANIKVRTIRFNIKAIDGTNCDLLLMKVSKLSLFTQSIGIRWFCIAFDLTLQDNQIVDKLCNLGYQVISKFENSFVNFIVGNEHINAHAVYKASEVVKKVSGINESGIDNFRLGISSNVKANTPFFPFSFSNTNDSFSVAVESTKKFTSVIEGYFQKDYIALKEKIIKVVSNDLIEIDAIAKNSAADCNIIYNGQDFSLSPFPDEDISVIEILNKLGIDHFGSNGTQFLTSYLTSILKELIDRLDIETVGFNGVMYSLLEDKLMCQAHDNNNFTMDSVILYSTVCGCGLDMVPLPGDVLTEEIASMVLDVATTSIKLDKPLGFRALPIKNKLAGDFTNLELDFLTNTKIPTVKHIHIDKSIFAQSVFHVKY